MQSANTCVYRAASIEEADIIVAWLAGEEINSFVSNRHVIGTGFLGQSAAPGGVEVCVLDPDQAEPARALLARHADEIRNRPPHTPVGKVFRAVCDQCGQASDFPSELFGSTQLCPRCRAYLDLTEPPSVC